MGSRLGKTTGWIHRAMLKDYKVKMLAGVTYHKVDSQGLHITYDGKPQVLKVDHVVVCAGQVPLRDLQEGLEKSGKKVHLIGGAFQASELDAKTAIAQATALGALI